MISVKGLDSRVASVSIATIILTLSATWSSVASASPATVRSNTNLRQGPGTNFGVIATVPGGTVVDISECAATWCTAHWAGRVGYMIATNLDLTAVPRPVVVYSPPPAVVFGGPYFYFGSRYYFGPRYRYGHHYRRRW